MIKQEYVVTGHLKESTGEDKQTYLLHRSCFADSKEQAIEFFHNFFEPKLKVIRIFSVVDNNGNVL
jgi:hypothetical protein